MLDDELITNEYAMPKITKLKKEDGKSRKKRKNALRSSRRIVC